MSIGSALTSLESLSQYSFRKEYRGDIQLLVRKDTSYVVSRRTSSDPEDWSCEGATQSLSTLELEETNRIKDLWKWGQERLQSHPTIKMSQQMKLQDLGRDTGEGSDCTVMVSSICDIQKQAANDGIIHPCGFMRIWDGSGPPVCDPYV